jgi:hypothetical protein
MLADVGYMGRMQLPLIWVVFLLTQLVITGVSFAVPAQPSLEPTLAYVFGFPALMAAGISVSGDLWRPRVPQLQTWYILRWALAEAATIMGFASWYTSGERLVQFACLGLAIVAIGVGFPRRQP